MSSVLVLYATREGQTQRIAEHIRTLLQARGVKVEVVDVALHAGPFAPAAYDTVFIAASVHGGHHEAEMVRFVRENREKLAQVPTAFLSVSLSEAGAEDESRPVERRQQASDDVEQMMQTFFRQTGWTPDRKQPVAGALRYSRYGMLVTFVMKRIAERQGGDTDTSRDYEYTDWPALDAFVSEFLASSTSTRNTDRAES